MKYSELVKIIKILLTDDLRLPKYRLAKNPLAGHCYVASEALYHLTKKSLKIMFVRHENQPHWFLKKENQIIDITASQFDTKVPYNNAKGKGFLTKYPSKRTQILLNRIKLIKDKRKLKK